MDRFSQLEFGDVKPDKPRQPGEPIRDADFFVNEALRYWLSGDFETALRNYSRVLEQNSALFEGWSGQILMLLEMGEYKEADIWADKAMDLFPDHPELLAHKAVANKRNARLKKAVAYSDNAISRDQLTSRVWLARAEVFLERKAVVVDGCISKAIALAQQDKPIVKFEAARLLRRKRSYVPAMHNLNEAVQLLPKAAMVWYELGCCQAKLGLPQAKASFEEALRLHPQWEPAYQALQRCAHQGFWGRLFRRG